MLGSHMKGMSCQLSCIVYRTYRTTTYSLYSLFLFLIFTHNSKASVAEEVVSLSPILCGAQTNLFSVVLFFNSLSSFSGETHSDSYVSPTYLSNHLFATKTLQQTSSPSSGVNPKSFSIHFFFTSKVENYFLIFSDKKS